MYTTFASILSLVAAASAANWGVTTPPSSVLPSTTTRPGPYPVPYPVPTCVVYYGWNDTSPSPLPNNATVMTTTSPTPNPTVAPRENWGVSSSSAYAVNASGPFTTSRPATFTVTLLPNATVYGSPGIPIPTDWPLCNYTGPNGGNATASPGVTISRNASDLQATSTAGAQAQGQGQGQGPSDTGAGYIVSSNLGAVTFIAAIGVALAL